MITIALSAFLCTIVVHIFFRADIFCKVPISVKIFFDGLARLYCMQVMSKPQSNSNSTELKKNSKRIGERIESYFRMYRQRIINTKLNNINKYNENIKSKIFYDVESLINLENIIKEIRDCIRFTRENIENRENELKLASDWRLLALILDRTFFIIFLLVTLITLFIMFINVLFKR